MTGQFYSHLNPKCDSGEFEEKGGCGVFAREPIKKGELICLWGGRIVASGELNPHMDFFTQRILQIEEGFYLEAPLPLEPTDCFNHSCDPNVGFTGQIGLVAMRDIHAGEEISITPCATARTTMSSPAIAAVNAAAARSKARTGLSL